MKINERRRRNKKKERRKKVVITMARYTAWTKTLHKSAYVLTCPSQTRHHNITTQTVGQNLKILLQTFPANKNIYSHKIIKRRPVAVLLLNRGINKIGWGKVKLKFIKYKV